MRSLLLTTAAAAVGLAFVAPAQAGDLVTGRPVKEDTLYQKRSHFIFNFGVQNGGDRLISLTDNTSGEEKDSARAGGYVRVTFGGEIALADSDFSIQIAGGMLQDGLTSNINSDKSTFTRKVIEFIPFWNFDRHRVGVGAVAHLDPKWTLDLDDQPTIRWEFDDAVGAVLQYDIRYDQDISVGARYTWIDYETVDDAPSQLDVTGRALGLHFTYAF